MVRLDHPSLSPPPPPALSLPFSPSTSCLTFTPSRPLARYEKDLPNCMGVTLIPDAQHAPALENPTFVSDAIIKFTKEKAWQKKAVAA